jgi:hypothetical protein
MAYASGWAVDASGDDVAGEDALDGIHAGSIAGGLRSGYAALVSSPSATHSYQEFTIDKLWRRTER